MLIEYKRNGACKEVAEPFASILVKSGVARFAEVRQLKPEPASEQDISPRTGKPKRQYRRRDMKAED